jgi:signal transduction histidine kinase
LQALLATLETVLGPQVEIEVSCDEPVVLVSADPSQFETAIVNLAVNARDAMDGQGRITIQIAEAYGVPGQAPETTLGEYVAVSITDTGLGIQPDDRPRIFEPFYTSKPQGQGTGLGLDTAWRIITTEHGGSINATSEPGRTTFRVWLPKTTPNGSAEAPQ